MENILVTFILFFRDRKALILKNYNFKELYMKISEETDPDTQAVLQVDNE